MLEGILAEGGAVTGGFCQGTSFVTISRTVKECGVEWKKILFNFTTLQSKH